jgi:hypothetical protein
MRNVMRLAVAASLSGLALGALAMQSATAADMGVAPQQGEAPPPYGPPPVQQGYAYPPPPVVYGYPPPPVAYYSYAVPPYVGVPGPYYWRGPYWRGTYGPRVAYGYGRWGRGFRR